MTYSICAHCPRTGQFGVGAMTAMPGVGKLVSHALAGSGAAASQAFMNPYLALDGLDLMSEGMSAQHALDRLVQADPGREGRQVGLVDAHGGAAAWTGSAPLDWKGDRTGEGWACQGNRLAGPEVLDAAIDAFHARPEQELVLRLMAALDAAEDAGGDTKGHESATVLVVETEAYPLWDLRIDQSERPLEDLHTLYDRFAEALLAEIRKMPTRANPEGEFDLSMSDEAV